MYFLYLNILRITILRTMKDLLLRIRKQESNILSILKKSYSTSKRFNS